jgi:oligopeptidase B
MKIPQLRKQPEKKSCHGHTWIDDYSWIHQNNCLEILRDTSKLNPEVRSYLEEENAYTKFQMKDTEEFQKKLFKEIKGRIKLDDESLHFFYRKNGWEYWTKTTTENNYPIQLRKKIGDDKDKIQEYWNGDKEKKKIGASYFGMGDLSVSHDHSLLGYSLDLNGSEFYTIYVRKIANEQLVTEKIKNTSGGITFSKNSQFIFYTLLNSKHQPKKVFRHKIGSSQKEDELIYEEFDPKFTVGMGGLTADEKFFTIGTSDHSTTETHYFTSDSANSEEKIKLKLFQKRAEKIRYSIDSWQNYFWKHTNEKSPDFKICRCKHENINGWEDFIPAKKEVVIGSFNFLDDWMIRGEMSNALPKLFVRSLKTNEEEELVFADEKVWSPSVSEMQKETNTDNVYISYSSPRTNSRAYIYNLRTREKKFVKQQEVLDKNYSPKNYITERLECKSHDGRLIPLTITRHKDTKIDGTANVLLYSYGSYGHSLSFDFSSTRLSLLNRSIIWVDASVRGGRERGEIWHEEGKMLNKKNTFEDYISAAKFLIEKKYTYKGGIIGYGGSAGGLLLGAVVNQAPELFLGMVIQVGFLNPLETNLDHSLPLTLGELTEFGDGKNNKEHFEYIKSYSPYHNIKKMNYPNVLLVTNLKDVRVIFDEPTIFTAKLRQFKTDKNLLLLKCELKNAGHGGKSGRDSAIEEIAFDYAFVLKIAGKLA